MALNPRKPLTLHPNPQDLTLDWSIIAWLKSICNLPVIAKARAVEHRGFEFRALGLWVLGFRVFGSRGLGPWVLSSRVRGFRAFGLLV